MRRQRSRSFHRSDSPSPRVPTGCRGVTLVEMLAVVALMGLMALIASLTWGTARSRSETKRSAKLLQTLVHQARMNAIYEGTDQFVVIDPANRRLEIYSDTGSTVNVFDTADPLQARSQFDPAVNMALPPGTTSLSNPVGGSNVTSAWTLPLPDSTQRWGSSLRGLIATPRGRITGAEASPTLIGTGIVVFSDGRGDAAAVVIRGGTASVKAFELLDGQWKEL